MKLSFQLLEVSSELYFDSPTADEGEIRTLADALYRRADGQWARNKGATITHGRTPESGCLKYRWEGYDEAMLLYMLGLGSPTHLLQESGYTACASTYRWEHAYGQEYLYAWRLFTHQTCNTGLRNSEGLQDSQ